MGEMRRRISPLVYQAGGNAVVYLCQPWRAENPGATAEGEREGAEGEQLFDSDYPFLSRGGVSITTLSLKPVRALSQLHCLLFGEGGGRLTFTQSLLTN